MFTIAALASVCHWTCNWNLRICLDLLCCIYAFFIHSFKAITLFELSKNVYDVNGNAIYVSIYSICSNWHRIAHVHTHTHTQDYLYLVLWHTRNDMMMFVIVDSPPTEKFEIKAVILTQPAISICIALFSSCQCLFFLSLRLFIIKTRWRKKRS